jgi:hypothetical protein
VDRTLEPDRIISPNEKASREARLKRGFFVLCNQRSCLASKRSTAGLLLHRRNTPSNNVARKITIKMKNRIFAISVAPLAIPPKPKNAAMIAMMKKMTAYRSMKPSKGSIIGLVCVLA